MKTFYTTVTILLSAALLRAQATVKQEPDSNSDKIHSADSNAHSNINFHIDVSLFMNSINLENKLYRSKYGWYQLNSRIGFGRAMDPVEVFFRDTDTDLEHYNGAIVALTNLFGKGNNHFEIATGFFFSFDSDFFKLPIFNIGYRYQKPKGGLIFKANVGFINVTIGLGYAF